MPVQGKNSREEYREEDQGGDRPSQYESDKPVIRVQKMIELTIKPEVESLSGIGMRSGFLDVHGGSVPGPGLQEHRAEERYDGKRDEIGCEES